MAEDLELSADPKIEICKKLGLYSILHVYFNIRLADSGATPRGLSSQFPMKAIAHYWSDPPQMEEEVTWVLADSRGIHQLYTTI